MRIKVEIAEVDGMTALIAATGVAGAPGRLSSAGVSSHGQL